MKFRLWNRLKSGIPVAVYMMIYIIWWAVLEHREINHYYVIHMPLDDKIPFCEYFIIPYLLWFVYVSATVLYLFFKDDTRKDYHKCLVFLFTGMTIFLIISTFWPNGHNLRPTALSRNNIFTKLLIALWRIDTPTNLWPSIHVYNALGAHFAIRESRVFTHPKYLPGLSFCLTLSIILSTVLIKQHSLFDVLTALGLAGVMYIIVYAAHPFPNSSANSLYMLQKRRE